MAVKMTDPHSKDQYSTDKYSHEDLVSLLPFYLSGKIERQDRDAVIQWLNKDADASFILEKVEAERMATITANETLQAPADGLKRLMQDVAGTRQEKSYKNSSTSVISWLKEKILAPLSAAPAELAWGACAMLMVISLSQSALLYQGSGQSQSTQPQSTEYNLASGEKHTILSTAVVKFADNAQMEKVAEYLDDTGTIIIDGPTASGLFVLGFIERDDLPVLKDRQKQFKENSNLISQFILKANK